MNLRGIYKVTPGHYDTTDRWVSAHRWSRCYRGRYNKRGPRFAQALKGRTNIWARHQDYNRPRRRKEKTVSLREAMEAVNYHRVFVYGTLKQGNRNNLLLSTATFIGAGTTVKSFLMRTVGFPILLRAASKAVSNVARVTGEVYLVNDATLARLDQLEGEGRMYRRVKALIDLETGERIKAHIYVGQGFYWRGGAVPVVDAVNGTLTWQR